MIMKEMLDPAHSLQLLSFKYLSSTHEHPAREIAALIRPSQQQQSSGGAFDESNNNNSQTTNHHSKESIVTTVSEGPVFVFVVRGRGVKDTLSALAGPSIYMEVRG